MNKQRLIGLLLIFLLLSPTISTAGETVELAIALPEFSVDFLTYFMFKNDNDFDRTRPVYSTDGQTVGAFATVFSPTAKWAPIRQVAFQYTLEIGDNIWSRNDVDQRDPMAKDIPVVRHKEFWAKVLFPGDFMSLKVGYQYLHDPTHLFVDRYMGAIDLSGMWDSGSISLIAGQIPDHVYEGVSATENASEFSENNFEHDDYLFGLVAKTRPEEVLISPGLYFRWDRTEVGRPEWLLTPVIHIDKQLCPRNRIDFDLLGVWGRHEKAGLDNRNIERLAIGAQFGLKTNAWPVIFDWNALVFSADDGDHYDQYDTSFPYSGWSKSRTLLLSENWIRDQYDNLDERAATQGAGLFLIDQDMHIHATQDLAFFIIVGYEMVLQNEHTDRQDKTIGTETDIGIEWALYEKHVMFTLLGGAVFPGGTGSVLLNEIDMERRHTLWHAQGAVELKF